MKLKKKKKIVLGHWSYDLQPGGSGWLVSCRVRVCVCVCVGLLCSSSVSVHLQQSLDLTRQLKSVSNHTLPVVRLLLPPSAVTVRELMFRGLRLPMHQMHHVTNSHLRSSIKRKKGGNYNTWA